jgi:hypothetical protein
LVLYADGYYRARIDPAAVPPWVTVVPFDLDTTETAALVAAADPPPVLPAVRHPGKDTLHFLTLVNAKPELVARAVRDGLIDTPHTGFIDGGVVKNFSDPAAGLARIRAADVSGLTNVLAPGFAPPRPLSPAEVLDEALWIFLGNLFLLPAARADEFCRRSLAVQRELLAAGRYTWEGNVWALLAARDPSLFTWYQATFSDRISHVPDVAGSARGERGGRR